MTAHQLFEKIKEKKSFLCVGLDTDLNKLPKILLEYEYPIFEFNRQIIEATVEYTIAYKPNLAFYEMHGAAGWISLEMTVNYLREFHPGVFIIADAKRGDIGNTSGMYAKAFFEKTDFDAVTVSPYMGSDSVVPFLEYKNKWIIILGLTSNKGAEDFQYFKDQNSNRMLFEQVLKTCSTWGTTDNTMFVVGATKAEMLKKVRDIVPDHFLLIPGIGAQGGSLEEVAKYGLNKKCGLIVNSSRAIIYADCTNDFAKVASIKAKEVQQEMKELLKKNKII
jgi:orotidine-5'-phosphate decarboxylase